jgi:hypothetical protein
MLSLWLIRAISLTDTRVGDSRATELGWWTWNMLVLGVRTSGSWNINPKIARLGAQQFAGLGLGSFLYYTTMLQ